MNGRDALKCCLVLCACWIGSLSAVAQDRSASINQTLDQPVKIQFDSVLPEAMNAITRTTGVRIEAEQSVWDSLPWGQQTNVNARIENQTLRQALDAITRKLGLTYTVNEEAVKLQPAPALRRVGRRATIDELQTLDTLAAVPFNRKSDRATIREVVDGIDATLADAKLPLAVDYRPGDTRQDKSVFIRRGATLAETLEAITQETELTWFPEGRAVVVLPREQQVRRQLGKILTMRFAGVDIAQALADLSERSGVMFEYEAGAIQRIPREMRNIQLVLDNSSVSQALETICGFTGLSYMVNSRGVYIWFNAYGRQEGPRDRVVGMMTLPDSGIEVIVFESQVPADVRQYINLRRETELGKIREMMIEQGFRPTTAPSDQTTQPAAQTDQDL